MSKFRQVLLSIAVTVGLCVSVAGCGQASTASNIDSKVSEAGTETATTEVESVNEEAVSDTLKKLREKGTLRVGSSGDAPFAYIDQQTGEFSGVDAEIIKEVAKRLGIPNVKMELISFSELILNLNAKNIDIICDCMYIRKDRAEQIYFGDIWYTQGGGVLVLEGSSINGQSTFDPKRTVVGYTAGTIWQTLVEGWVEQGLIKEAIATGDQSESIVALQYGKMDAFVTDSTVLENIFANSPDTVKGLRLCTDYQDTPETIGRIAPSVAFDDIAFMKEVNQVVYELREEGFIEEVFKQYGLDPALHMITNSDEDRLHDVNTVKE